MSTSREPAALRDEAPGGCEWVDALPRELRGVVHDYGESPVRLLYRSGIRSAAQMRQIIVQIRVGSSENGNKRPKGTNRMEGLIDDLIGGMARPTTRELVAALRHLGLTVVPVEPTDDALLASMTAIDGMPPLTKEKKHRLRLRAALRAMDAGIWDR